MSRRKHTSITPGENGAIYCRISHAKDEDQTGVDRQERICRDIAERLQLTIAPEHVYVDNNRSAWQRNRKRPGWKGLLADMTKGEFRHVIVYHPDRLMRQPKDLEELLSLSDDKQVLLHGEANRRDLSDPDDRFILRIEVAHACRSSDDTSRRLKDMWVDHAKEGKPHFGNRPYGYTRDGKEVVEEEAEIVREVFRRYLDGQSPTLISQDLARRKVPTTKGKVWQPENVRHLLSSNYVAGIRTHHGEERSVGIWPAIIDRGQWDEVQACRTHRAAAIESKRKNPNRYYVLRGIATCTCGARMAGTNSGRYAYYRCTRAALNGEQRCGRSVSAGPLERFMRAVVIKALTEIDVSGRPVATTTRPAEDIKADERDSQKLKDLYEMWDADEMPTQEYRQKRREIERRMRDRQRQTVQRPIAVLTGIAGPDAEESWRSLEQAEEFGRINAIYQFFFSAVVIHPTKKKGRGFDTDRVEVRPNPLP